MKENNSINFFIYKLALNKERKKTVICPEKLIEYNQHHVHMNIQN